MANKKKAVSRAAIGELIRKHKGKNAVESENIGGCKNPKYHRYQFVGLSGGVLHLDLENLTEHMMPADSKTAKKWHVRRAAALKREEAKLAKAAAKKAEAK